MKMVEYAYIGKKPKCCCTVAVTVDDGKTPKLTAKDVKDFINEGLIVERIQLTELKMQLCKCDDNQTSR